MDEDEGPPVGDDDFVTLRREEEQEFPANDELPPQVDDDEADQTFEMEPVSAQRAKANSRRKRKSDLEVLTSSPAPKRVRTQSPANAFRAASIPSVRNVSKPPVAESSKASSQQPKKKSKARSALGPKSNNSKVSSRYPKELNDVVDRVRSRPNPPKSLYILHRETPADDGVTQTRSGRVSFKPLAYWRNEQCVFGGSPGSRGLQDGARFPLNSVKEIIRTEEVAQPMGKKKKSKKGKGRARSKSKAAEAESSDSESDVDPVDPDAEPWESDVGTLRGRVSVWDAEAQQPIDEEEEIDIAYAPAAIEASVVNVKSGSGPSFKYAKLLGNKFMGVGLVDLEPGGIKRPKNSRKMHMSFFVVKGRVTVNVGPAGGDETGTWLKFGIGKGGFWQVPRGKSSVLSRCFHADSCDRQSILD